MYELREGYWCNSDGCHWDLSTTLVKFACALLPIYAQSHMYHSHFAMDCCWVHPVLLFSGVHRIQFMVSSSGCMFLDLTYQSQLAHQDLYLNHHGFLLQVMWPCSRTLGVYIVIILLDLNMNSAWPLSYHQHL